MPEPTVWIVNKSAHNFEKAKEWGNVKYISDSFISPFGTTTMYRLAEQALKHSKPTDYILPTGLPTMNIIVCSYFVNKHGKLNLLLFKRDRGRNSLQSFTEYKEREVIFGEEE